MRILSYQDPRRTATELKNFQLRNPDVESLLLTRLPLLTLPTRSNLKNQRFFMAFVLWKLFLNDNLYCENPHD